MAALYGHMEETPLLQRARDGDLAAFEALVRPLVDPACRLAHAILRDWPEAEDAVQEALFRAWRRVGGLRHDTRDIRPWLLTIVANEARSRRRGRWWSVVRLPLVAETGHGPGPEEQVALSADLRQAMRRLGETQRLILFLHFYLDLPIEEVGAVLGLSPAAVRSRMYRATRSLRPILGEEPA
jgi:RNA polymerase sigma factor (sigma-70 family)